MCVSFVPIVDAESGSTRAGQSIQEVSGPPVPDNWSITSLHLSFSSGILSTVVVQFWESTIADLIPRS